MRPAIPRAICSRIRPFQHSWNTARSAWAMLVGLREQRLPRSSISSPSLNKRSHWRDLIGATDVTVDDGGTADLKVEHDDELASFQL